MAKAPLRVVVGKGAFSAGFRELWAGDTKLSGLLLITQLRVEYDAGTGDEMLHLTCYGPVERVVAEGEEARGAGDG